MARVRTINLFGYFRMQGFVDYVEIKYSKHLEKTNSEDQVDRFRK